MPVLLAYAVFALIGGALYGLLYLGARLAGDSVPDAQHTAGFISVALMLPFFVITLLVAWIQYLVQNPILW